MARSPSTVGKGPASGGNESLFAGRSSGAIAGLASAGFTWLPSLSRAQEKRARVKRMIQIVRIVDLINCTSKEVQGAALTLDFLLFLSGTALRRMYEISDPNADSVQRDHGSGKNAHTQDVGSGC